MKASKSDQFTNLTGMAGKGTNLKQSDRSEARFESQRSRSGTEIGTLSASRNKKHAAIGRRRGGKREFSNLGDQLAISDGLLCCSLCKKENWVFKYVCIYTFRASGRFDCIDVKNSNSSWFNQIWFMWLTCDRNRLIDRSIPISPNK